MYKTIALALLLALGLFGLTAPEPPPVFGAAAPVLEPWRPEVERLIARLGDTDFRVREDAERRLMAMGVKIVPVLRRAVGHRDLDVRRRVLTMIPALESAALVAPKRITLKIEKKPIRLVFEAMSKHTGYKIMHWGGPGGGAAGETVYSFDFKNATFWEAMDEICKASGFVLQQSWGDDQIRLQSQGAVSRHSGRAGAFRYSASNFQLYRNVDLAAVAPGGAPPARTENLTFNFLLFAEPRLPFMGMGEVQLDAAYDDLKNSMLIPRDPAPPGFPGGGPWVSRSYYGGKQLSMHVSVALRRASPKATTLKMIRGSVPVTLLVEQKPLVVTDKVMSSKGKKYKVDRVQFSIEDVNKQPNGQYQIKMTITNEAADGDPNWINNLYQRLELHDDKGQKFQPWGTSWGNNGPGFVQITFTYGQFGAAKMSPPAKLIYHSWRTRQHHILFEFRDVLLP